MLFDGGRRWRCHHAQRLYGGWRGRSGRGNWGRSGRGDWCPGRRCELGLLDLAVRDVVVNLGLVGRWQVGYLAQVLFESVDGIIPVVALFVATALVEDVGGIIAFHKEVAQNIDAFIHVASNARLFCCPFPC